MDLISANSFIAAIQNFEPMNLTQKICNHLSERIESNQLSNEDCLRIIEHIGSYLNLQTVSDYSRNAGISYNGTKKFRTVKKIFNVKFVIDNE